MADVKEPRYVLRNRSQIIKGVVLCMIGLVFVIATLIEGTRLVTLIPPLLVCGGAIGTAAVLYFLPAVTLDTAGVTVRNWVRSVRIPWSEFTGVENRYDTAVLSSVRGVPHRDTVASFPGSGGITRGRDRLSDSHPLHRSESGPSSPMSFTATSGTHTRWITFRQFPSALERYREKHARRGGGTPRVQHVEPVSAVILGLSLLLIAAGIWSVVLLAG